MSWGRRAAGMYQAVFVLQIGVFAVRNNPECLDFELFYYIERDMKDYLQIPGAYQLIIGANRLRKLVYKW